MINGHHFWSPTLSVKAPAQLWTIISPTGAISDTVGDSYHYVWASDFWDRQAQVVVCRNYAQTIMGARAALHLLLT